jgi:hypothetical protein
VQNIENVLKSLLATTKGLSRGEMLTQNLDPKLEAMIATCTCMLYEPSNKITCDGFDEIAIPA